MKPFNIIDSDSNIITRNPSLVLEGLAGDDNDETYNCNESED